MSHRWTFLPVLISMAVTGVATAAMNPANPGFPRVTTVFGGTYDNNNYSAMCVVCHTRNPGARTADTAGLGSHFIFGGTGVLPTANTGFERLTAWTGTGGPFFWSGGMSKYGKPNDNISIVGTTGEMLCESCHNLLRNTGVNKLLAADNEATDPSALCEGCHARTGAGHHILTPETGFPEISTLLGRTLSTADSYYVRNTPLAGSEVTYPAANAINCRSCHKAHDAQTQAGARILKRGYRTTDNAAVQGDGVNGMERTTENSINPGTKILKDEVPLCNACHKVSY
ncbi:MAG: NapC/NirT family cytochrome c [bacterium]|nr:NapC/NirT family cytochrome c [bacterium]